MAFTRIAGRHRRTGQSGRSSGRLTGAAGLAATGVVAGMAAPAVAQTDGGPSTDSGLRQALAVGDRIAEQIDAQADAQEAEAVKARAEVEAKRLAARARKRADETQRVRAARAAERKRLNSFVRPVAGAGLATPYHAASGLWSSGRHTGVDFHAASGTVVRAVGAGRVVEAGWGGAYGNNVVLRMADGTYTQYGHLSSIGVSVGQTVGRGEQIGLSGDTGNTTGPHLHFEARTGPEYGSDIDPLGYLRAHGVEI